jgi:hypothetical protein
MAPELQFIALSQRGDGSVGSAAFHDSDARSRLTPRSNLRHEAIGVTMNLNLTIGPLVSLIAGILILMVPRLLNYIVAIYLIVIGLLGLFGAGSMHYR